MGVFLLSASYLLISTVAQPTGCPGSSVLGLHVGLCKRQEGGKGGRVWCGCRGGEGGMDGAG